MVTEQSHRRHQPVPSSLQGCGTGANHFADRAFLPCKRLLSTPVIPLCRLYGRLALGDASIRFELPGLTVLQDEAAVVLHGTLRIKPIRQGRASHEVILVGDVVSEWKPLTPATGQPVPLPARTHPRMSLEMFIAEHGFQSIAFLATPTAWQDLSQGASMLTFLQNCRRQNANFMKAEQFEKDLLELFANPNVKAVVITRGGGEGLDIIGDSRQMAFILLASNRPFYTALGHDKDVSLLDKFADQSSIPADEPQAPLPATTGPHPAPEHSTGVPDVMDELLAMVSGDGPAPPSNEAACLITKPEPAELTTSQPPPPREPAPAAATDSAGSRPSGEHFMAWLKQAITLHRLIINDAKALVYTVDDTVYLVSPGLFQRYAQEHPQIGAIAKQEQQDWQWVQKQFEKLQLHRKQAMD